MNQSKKTCKAELKCFCQRQPLRSIDWADCRQQKSRWGGGEIGQFNLCINSSQWKYTVLWAKTVMQLTGQQCVTYNREEPPSPDLWLAATKNSQVNYGKKGERWAKSPPLPDVPAALILRQLVTRAYHKAVMVLAPWRTENHLSPRNDTLAMNQQGNINEGRSWRRNTGNNVFKENLKSVARETQASHKGTIDQAVTRKGHSSVPDHLLCT